MLTSEKLNKKKNSLAFDIDEMLAIVQSIKAYQNLCPTLSGEFIAAGNRALKKLRVIVNRKAKKLTY